MRDRATRMGVALLPILLFIALHFLGYMKLARLGALALAALAIGAVAFLRPRWGLWGLLFYVYSGIGLFLPVNLAAPLLGIVVGSVLLEWMRGMTPRLPGTFFWVSVGLFILAALNSTLLAHDMAAALIELGAFLKVLLVILLIVHLVRTPEQLRTTAYVVFAGAVCTIVLGMLAIATGFESAGENFIAGVRVMRFTGAHVDPNKAAAYMCTAVPLGLFALRHCESRILRVGFIVGTVALVVAVFATFSRGAIVSMTAVLVGMSIYEVRSRRSFAVFALVLTTGIVLAPRYYWARLTGLSSAFENTTQDWSVYTRMLALRTAWEMFLNHPLTGVGLGNFLTASASQLFVRIVVHNTYIEILTATGILGLLWFLGIIGSGVRDAVAGARQRWVSQPAWMRALSYYTALSALSIGLSAVFLSMPFRYPLWVPVAMGLVVGGLLRAEKQA